MVQIEPTNLHGWKGYRLGMGEVTVGVVPGIGGRIISLTHRGQELLFVHDDHKAETFDFQEAPDLREEKKRLGFRIWGGDKTWIAPQSAWWEDIPPLELDAGSYRERIEGAAIVLESPLCRETGLRVTRRVEMLENGEVLLEETLTNPGPHEIKRGLWNVTQCRRPFDVYLPATASCVHAYAEEGESQDLRETVLREESGWTVVRCQEAVQFKFGCLARTGHVLAAREQNGESIVFSRTFETDPLAEYAHGSSVEVYNSFHHDYLEIEIHAPLASLAPGGTTTLRQKWKIDRYPSSPDFSRIIPHTLLHP